MYTSGETQVENRTIALDTAIVREHEIVHRVFDLMRTLIDKPLRKHRSNNLKEKAKIIEDKIGKILQSSDSDDIKEKAICIVEQGYAVLFEEFKENELEAQQKLADSFELIKAEQSSSIEKRKDLLCLALKYTVNAQRLLCLAINCKSDDTVAEEKKSSIEMFQKGIQYLRNTSYSMENIYIWTYYYAMACNRMPYNANDIGIQAVYLFWSVISNLPKDDERFSIYRARSYAYIGHKIITRNEAFNASLSTSSLTSDAKFLALLKAPLSAFELAIAELPYDEVILNRKGTSLWSLFKFGSAKTDNEKLDYLEQAEETLSLSIITEPTYGPEAVSNSEYLNEALDYLNQCISAKGQTYFTAFTIGIIYFDMAEYRMATEWLKRSFMFSDPTRASENVKSLCMSVLKLGDTSIIHAEFIHVLTFIANRMNGLEFLNNLVPKGLWKDYLGKLCEFMIFLETFHLTTDQVKIAEYLKTVLIKKDFLNSTTFKNIIAPTIKQIRIRIRFKCSWSGGIDYDSCSSLLETTIEGIKECRKSILVLSKGFLKENGASSKQ
ncbi:unnamed protein product [Mytilus edulis]|uniref:Uncharacterized protein n=1 Tax=Mytilus edulis TaxID=6550 RepID=A0A8S3Q6K4_MYTED|nr:unnamed protein product [Mytilus edulis]